MAAIVSPAFLASGGLKAGTPFAIASVPVSATEPLAKALSSRNTPRPSLPSLTASGLRGRGAAAPVRMWNVADRDDGQGQADEQVRRDGEDVARLAQAAQVGDGDERDRQDARSRPGRR